MKLFFQILTTVLGVATCVSGGVYDAGGGADFQITYSEDWYRVPYGEANAFLDMQGIEDTTFEYNAVLAKITYQPFYQGPYIFLCSEPVGRLQDEQVEAILQVISAEYGKSFVFGTLDHDLNDWDDNQPVYDSVAEAIAIKSTITGSAGNKTFLEIRKFYENGIATFLCYAPDQLYSACEPEFLSVFHSFSVNVANDALTIVDIQSEDNTGAGFFSGNTTLIIIVFVVLATVVLAIIWIKRN